MSPGDKESDEYATLIGPFSVALTLPTIAAPHVIRGCGLPYAPIMYVGAQPDPSSVSRGAVPVIFERSAPSTIGNTSRSPWMMKSIAPTVAPSANVGVT